MAMTKDNTRYQILLDKSVENFTAAQLRQFKARCQELTKAGTKFTTWDTKKNALSGLFRI